MKTTYDIFYFLGAGGYGKQLSEFLKKNKIINKSIFVDDKKKLKISNFLKLKKEFFFNIFVGNSILREKIYKRTVDIKNLKYSTLILPGCFIYTQKIAKGCIVEHNVILSSGVSVGLGSIILSGSIIGHGTSVGKFSNVGTNVSIAGNTKIGNKVSIGSQSFVSNNIKICDNVIVVPGSVVLKNINKPGVYKDNTVLKLL